MNNIFIREDKFPYQVKAFTLPDSDGNYNIYINEHLSDEVKKKALRHEKNHIESGDIYSEESAIDLEKK